MPHATARWVDQKSRAHEWNAQVAPADRNQIKTQIKARTGAKDVIIRTVRG